MKGFWRVWFALILSHTAIRILEPNPEPQA